MPRDRCLRRGDIVLLGTILRKAADNSEHPTGLVAFTFPLIWFRRTKGQRLSHDPWDPNDIRSPIPAAQSSRSWLEIFFSK